MVEQALFRHIQTHLERIEQEIQRTLNTEIPLLNNVAEYVFSAGGKRVRPAVSVYACQMFQPKIDPVLYVVAASLEHLHTATLLHDDVVDEAQTRRGRKAARMLWGNQASVLVGDYLLAHVFRALTTLGQAVLLEAVSDAAKQMAKGEILQLVYRHETASEEDYMQIITYKTACLFAASARVGAAVAGASQAAQMEMQEYGHQLGLVFQITDDILDYFGNEETLGKPVGSDLCEGKMTLPIHRLLQHATTQEKNWIMALFKQQEPLDPSHVQQVVEMMRAKNIGQKTIATAKIHAQKGLDCLTNLPNSASRSALQNLIQQLIARSS